MTRQRREKAMQGAVDVPTLRKMLIWGVPLYLGGMSLCWYMFEKMVMSTYVDIRSYAPVIEITGVALISPLAFVFLLSALLVFIPRALYLDRIANWIQQYILIKVAIVLAVSMGLIGVLSWPVQDYFMPKFGYSRCGILYGHTSLMSAARWLKYPELCVRDKSIAWVKEQAQLIEQQQGPSPKP